MTQEEIDAARAGIYEIESMQTRAYWGGEGYDPRADAAYSWLESTAPGLLDALESARAEVARLDAAIRFVLPHINKALAYDGVGDADANEAKHSALLTVRGNLSAALTTNAKGGGDDARP